MISFLSACLCENDRLVIHHARNNKKNLYKAKSYIRKMAGGSSNTVLRCNLILSIGRIALWSSTKRTNKLGQLLICDHTSKKHLLAHFPPESNATVAKPHKYQSAWWLMFYIGCRLHLCTSTHPGQKADFLPPGAASTSWRSVQDK